MNEVYVNTYLKCDGDLKITNVPHEILEITRGIKDTKYKHESFIKRCTRLLHELKDNSLVPLIEALTDFNMFLRFEKDCCDKFIDSLICTQIILNNIKALHKINYKLDFFLSLTTNKEDNCDSDQDPVVVIEEISSKRKRDESNNVIEIADDDDDPIIMPKKLAFRKQMIDNDKVISKWSFLKSEITTNFYKEFIRRYVSNQPVGNQTHQFMVQKLQSLSPSLSISKQVPLTQYLRDPTTINSITRKNIDEAIVILYLDSEFKEEFKEMFEKRDK